jgi:hypothetical protein
MILKVEVRKQRPKKVRNIKKERKKTQKLQKHTNRKNEIKDKDNMKHTRRRIKEEIIQKVLQNKKERMKVRTNNVEAYKKTE